MHLEALVLTLISSPILFQILYCFAAYTIGGIAIGGIDRYVGAPVPFGDVRCCWALAWQADFLQLSSEVTFIAGTSLA